MNTKRKRQTVEAFSPPPSEWCSTTTEPRKEVCSVVVVADEFNLQTQPSSHDDDHDGGSEWNGIDPTIAALNTQSEEHVMASNTISSDEAATSTELPSLSLEAIKTQQEDEPSVHKQVFSNHSSFGKTKKRKINQSSNKFNENNKTQKLVNSVSTSDVNTINTSESSSSNTTGKVFGNYKNYYSYRYSNENLGGSSSSTIPTTTTATTHAKKQQNELSHIDPRLEIIARILSTHFKLCEENPTTLELSCLDIGCNQGLFTIQMADLIDSSLSNQANNGQIPITLKSLDAIDIDAKLIRQAKNHLEALKKFNTIEDKESMGDDHLGMSVQTYVSMERLETAADKEEKLFIWENNRKLLKTKGENVQSSEQIVLCKKSYMLQLIYKIHFKTQNFVEEIASLVTHSESLEKARENKYESLLNASLGKTKRLYDLITCLSVTKWIHLNYGDDSIKFLFHKIFSMLKSNGGIFVLEPQTWKSYAKKRDLTPTFQEQFKNIKFRPTAFHEYLMKEVGFSQCETVFIEETSNNSTTSEKTKKKGFKKRPICFYFK
ncbi:hypothetical protein FDP41_001201 [Naegleria fowleri]|uniref:RNA methyltransferase n=1 Tax=Naegleria fowleri TaxID=5763 RepID=A0A6A5C2D1_NAEFO|nr:uncharacterized protein FDP41_001201 [Naegleria fowleri]KAF0980048.1 hypothetical protein FDP41_001201 [Naegleria fowleri]